MVSWGEFATAAPALAGQVRAAFAVRKHAVMASSRRDGSPRVSGTEVDFDAPRGPTIAMPADAVRAGDLRADPRIALHCPTVDAPADDPGAWGGDGKIAGHALPLPSAPVPGAVGFRIDITEVVWTGIAATADHLVIRSWHPDRGLQEHRRA